MGDVNMKKNLTAVLMALLALAVAGGSNITWLW
jgi:hypothetical protein